ncbi:MAG: substrate-binding domain-containing protein [Planctomycetes bacterium]|nr:substrate-binding domain-containing protein [Planctomycetota bacterium]
MAGKETRGAVTLKQVAETCGVSLPTVSHVLGNRGHRYSDATRRRVYDTAQRLGYRTNAAARATASGKFNNIALLQGTSKWASSLPAETLGGIHDALTEQGMHLTVAKVADEKLTNPDYVPRILRQWMCDGLLINYHAMIPERLIELVHDNALPSVWLNCKMDQDCVHPDDLGAGRTATEQLLEAGHRRIAYVDTGLDISRENGTLHYSRLDRLAGYREAMNGAGLQTSVVTDERRAQGSLVDFLVAWLRLDDRPTAIVANSRIDVDTIRLIAARVGIWGPNQLSLITFGQEDTSPSELRITTWLVPHRDIANEGVAMLMQKIAEPTKRLNPCAVPFTLDPGVTIASPAS